MTDYYGDDTSNDPLESEYALEELFDNGRLTSTAIIDKALHGTNNKFCATGPGGGVDPHCGKDDPGSGSVVGKLKALGATVHTVEYAVKDKVLDAVSKLPEPYQTATIKAWAGIMAAKDVAFAGWTANQALAEKVAIEKGATAAEAKALRGVLSGIDLALFKPLAIATAPLGAAVGAATWVIPPATGAYLAYSTAKNPVAVLKAAVKLIKESIHGAGVKLGEYVGLAHNSAENSINRIADALQRHGYRDSYIALLSVAIDETGDVQRAMELADELDTQMTFNCNPNQIRGSDGKCGPGSSGIGISRDFMPQINGEDIPEFLQFAESRGVNVMQTSVQADQLRPTQSEFRQERVDAIPDSKLYDPILVSDDSYVLDGTHRWIKQWQRDTEAQVPVTVIGLPVREALALMQQFPKAVFVGNTQWSLHQQADKVKAFAQWLAQKLQPLRDRQLVLKYVNAAFQKGAARSFDEVRKTVTLDQQQLDMLAGAKQQFLRMVINAPVPKPKPKPAISFSFGGGATKETLDALADRSLNDLNGITDAMSTKMIRTLHDGLASGASPRDLVSDLMDDANISESRATTIARTEIVRAHAEGQLAGMSALGVEEVGVQVEWSTTGDEKVCPDCESMEGVVMDIEDAHGQIPLHPNCRCAWVPALPEGLLPPTEDEAEGVYNFSLTFERFLINCGGKGSGKPGPCPGPKKVKVIPVKKPKVVIKSKKVAKPKGKIVKKTKSKKIATPAPATTTSVKLHGMSSSEAMTTTNANGVPLNVGGAVNFANVKAMMNAIKIAKADFPEKLFESIGSVNMTSQSNKDDAYWQKTYNMPNLKSKATGGDGNIVVYSGGAIDSKLLAHEAGHNLAFKIWGGTKPPPSSAYGIAQSKEKPVSSYGSKSSAEDFADACAMYAKDNAELKASFPLKYAALSTIFGKA